MSRAAVYVLRQPPKRAARFGNGLRTDLPFRHWSLTPPKRGLYVRDWRGTDVLPESERCLSMDLWEPLPPGDEMGPGLWYVWPGWNDASVAALPWRKPMPAEVRRFLADNPEARP